MFGDAYTHRITAGVLLAYLGYLFVALRLGRWARPALLLLVLYSVQVVAGDATVFTDLGTSGEDRPCRSWRPRVDGRLRGGVCGWPTAPGRRRRGQSARNGAGSVSAGFVSRVGRFARGWPVYPRSAVLLTDSSTITSEVEALLDRVARRPGHIMNLGRGIDRHTPSDHVTAFVEAVRS